MHDVAQAFIEGMGRVMESNGMPRTAGRMLGFFTMDPHPHTLDEIAEQLQVSKASVSTNARLLEHHGLLERHTQPGDRRDFYRLSDSPYEQMFAVAKQRMTQMLRLYETTLAQIPPELEEARRRLETGHRFHAFMLDDLDRKLERWHEALRAQEERLRPA